MCYLSALPLLVGYARNLARALGRLPGKQRPVEPPDDLLYLFGELRTEMQVQNVGLQYVRSLDPERPLTSPVMPLLDRVAVAEEVWHLMSDDERRFALAWRLRQASRMSETTRRRFWSMTRMLFALGLAGAIHPLLGIFTICYLYTPRKRKRGKSFERTLDLLRAARECETAEGPLAFIARLSDPQEARFAAVVIRRRFRLPPVEAPASTPKLFSWTRSLYRAAGGATTLWAAGAGLALFGKRAIWTNQYVLITSYFLIVLACERLIWHYGLRRDPSARQDPPGIPGDSTRTAEPIGP